MLDPYLLRNKLDIVAKKLASRGFKLDVSRLRSLEKRRKFLQLQTESLQARRNSISKNIGQAKIRGEDIKSVYSEANKVSKELNKAKHELKILQLEINNIILTIPNLPDDSVPIGTGEKCNVEVKRWGNPREFDFKIRDHVTLGEMHDGFDFAAAVKLTGSRFIVMQGQIANLNRALSQFMLDLHTRQHGYIETYVPYLVNRRTLYSTGQLPKFANDLFHVNSTEGEVIDNNYTLIPTAEVPLTNLFYNESINEEDLPIKLTAYSPCFRSEAGSYGRDTRGLIRMHQFDKIEIVQIVLPKNSMNALEEMTCHAERVLELLGLPYRRMKVCTGDIGFVACKAYDLEVWVPTRNSYLEISSCSNVWDFQARRMRARYYSRYDKKTHLVHTLNGSGLAVGRTLVAILENYQYADGSIKIPEVLRPYMNGQKYIR